jgi:hypothetical protein
LNAQSRKHSNASLHSEKIKAEHENGQRREDTRRLPYTSNNNSVSSNSNGSSINVQGKAFSKSNGSSNGTSISMGDSNDNTSGNGVSTFPRGDATSVGRAALKHAGEGGNTSLTTVDANVR